MKQAARTLPPATIQLVTTVLSLTLIPIYLGMAKMDFGKVGYGWAAFSVIFGAAGGLLNLTALTKMDAGTVTALVGTYPVFTLSLAVLLGQETLSTLKLVGVLLVVLGMAALSV